ncbi:MAG: hypothetical protein ACJ8F1_13925 [Polyangia bacterium]
MARALELAPSPSTAGLRAAKRRFREIFPRAFVDPTYLEWERGYKWEAHVAWQHALDRATWSLLLEAREYREIGGRIARWYARSHLNMLALYEWMALREALEDRVGARLLARGFYDLLHGAGTFGERLETFTAVLDDVPQRQTRLAKWPVVTLIPFAAHPRRHLIVKPNLMKRAAERLGFPLDYASRPNAATYAAVMRAVAWLWRELEPWHPRDLIDIQGFIWVTCSEEYETWPWE